jgi:hypothetical protein
VPRLSGAATANPGEWQCGEVGQTAEEQAGRVGKPFWPTRRSGAHRSVLTVTMAAEAEALTVAGQRGGRGIR